MSEEKKKPGIWALIVKLGGKFLSFFIKFLKVGKLALAAITFASYSYLFTWKFALLLMIAIGFHESGHVWAMKKIGIKTSGFFFIPFFGGAAVATESCKTYAQTAYIAIMGPIWGTALAYATLAIYYTTGQPLWAAAAAWMAVVNLFNLLPITPLDGGHMLKSICFSINQNLGLIFLGVSLVGSCFLFWHIRAFLFIVLLAVGALEFGVEVWHRRSVRKISANLRQSLTDMHCTEQEIQEAHDQVFKSKKPTTEPLSPLHMGLTVGSYALTIGLLFGILLVIKQVPGADIAANFFE